MDQMTEVAAYADRLRAAGRGEEARRLIRRLVCFAPEAATAWAASAIDAPAPARAAALARDIRLDPSGLGARTEAHRAAADAYAAAGRADRAEAHFRAWSALSPGDVEAYFATALRRHLAADPEGSSEPFRRAAILQPHAHQAQLNAGSARFDSGRWREAEGFIRRALALQPAHAYALFQSARCRRRLADPDDAFRLLTRARLLAGGRPDFDAELAHVNKERGDWTEALKLGRRLTLEDPGGYDPWFACGVAQEHTGDVDAALRAYDRAVRANPAFGEAFTRRAVTLLRRRLGPPPPPRTAAAQREKRLGATQLGVNGRFGNQVLQYGFLRVYAAAHDLTLETPDWAGRLLFDADDPQPGPPLPRIQESEGDFMASLNHKGAPEFAGCDLIGFFCGDTTPLSPHRDGFRAAFAVGSRVAGIAAALEAALRSRGDTVVALHLRRGDFGWGRFWIAPVEWYLDWLGRIWPHLKRPVLYIASDEPALAAEFADFAPLTAADMGPPLPGAEFFTDFHVLRSADVLAISNSSFSFSAAMLNEKAWLTARPDRIVSRLRVFDPWSAPVLLD